MADNTLYETSRHTPKSNESVHRPKLWDGESTDLHVIQPDRVLGAYDRLRSPGFTLGILNASYDQRVQSVSGIWANPQYNLLWWYETTRSGL